MKIFITESQFKNLIEQELPPLDIKYQQDVLKPYIDPKLIKAQQSYLTTKDKIDKIDKTKVQSRIENLLIQAKKWWSDWLDSDITKAKFAKLNNLDSTWVEYYFYMYKWRLQDIKIKLVNKLDDKLIIGANAYVVCYVPTTIYFNLEYGNSGKDIDIIGTLIHEIQHLLYCIKPLTPQPKQTKFSSGDGCFETRKEKFKSLGLEKKDKINILSEPQKNSISSQLGINKEEISKKVQSFINLAKAQLEKDNGAYLNNRNEILSRLFKSRYYFGVKPGQNITIGMINDYIKNRQWKERNSNVDFFLAKWALDGYPNIQPYLDELNSYVSRDTESQTKTV
jgi:hypothetical protein